MKFLVRPIFTIFFSFVFLSGISQNWKLDKNKDGIKAYLAENPKSKFKSIRVECTLAGTYDRLIAILTDIDHLKDWVYNTKMSYPYKKTFPL